MTDSNNTENYFLKGAQIAIGIILVIVCFFWLFEPRIEIKPVIDAQEINNKIVNIENAQINQTYNISHLNDNFEVVLKDLDFKNYSNYSQNTNYLLAFFEIKNISANTINFYPNIYLVDLDSEKYDDTSFYDLLNKEYSKTLPSFKELPPNTKMSGWVVFKIPEDKNDFYLYFNYSNSFLDDTPKYIKWKIEPKFELISEPKLNEGPISQPEQIANIVANVIPDIIINFDENTLINYDIKTEISYLVRGVLHNGVYDINIYERLYSPYDKQMWKNSYDIGRRTGNSTHDLSYNLYFTPTVETYPSGYYTLQITILDNITNTEIKKEIGLYLS